MAENPSKVKQNKDIDDKRMFKVGIEVLRKDFCIQIGYNRRAVKNYSKAISGAQNEALSTRHEVMDSEEIVDMENINPCEAVEENDTQEILYRLTGSGHS